MVHQVISAIFICLSILHCNVRAVSVDLGTDGLNLGSAVNGAASAATDAAGALSSNIEGQLSTGAGLAAEAISNGNPAGVVSVMTDGTNGKFIPVQVSNLQEALNAAVRGELLGQIENQLSGNANLVIPSGLTTGLNTGLGGTAVPVDISSAPGQIQSAIEVLAARQGLNNAMKQYINMGDRTSAGMSRGFGLSSRNAMGSLGFRQSGVAPLLGGGWQTMENARSNAFNVGRQFADGSFSGGPIQRLAPLAFSTGNNGLFSGGWSGGSLSTPSAQVETEVEA